MLFVDVGNSRIKWWCGERSGSAPSKDFAAIASWLKELEGVAFSAAVISSVVAQEYNDAMEEALVETFNVRPVFAKVVKQLGGVTAAYSVLDHLGVDRWLAIIGAYDSCRSACVVVSAGSAITVDAVDQSGQHLGGLILPGYQLMLEALFGKADRIPSQPLTLPQNWALGCDTLACIENGFSALMTGLFSEVSQNLVKDDAQVILTGGAAKELQQYLPKANIDEKLVLKGLGVYIKHC